MPGSGKEKAPLLRCLVILVLGLDLDIYLYQFLFALRFYRSVEEVFRSYSQRFQQFILALFLCIHTWQVDEPAYPPLVHLLKRALGATVCLVALLEL